MFLLTAKLSDLVPFLQPYNFAKSESNMTCLPLISYIIFSIFILSLTTILFITSSFQYFLIKDMSLLSLSYRL